jgi:hypothetical protein
VAWAVASRRLATGPRRVWMVVSIFSRVVCSRSRPEASPVTASQISTAVDRVEERLLASGLDAPPTRDSERRPAFHPRRATSRSIPLRERLPLPGRDETFP